MAGKRKPLFSFTLVSVFAALLLLPTLLAGGNYQADAAVIRLKQTEFKFSVEPAAPTLPADGGSYYALVQLQTLRDSKPMEAPYDLEIDISSSNPTVVKAAQSKVTLKEGESFVKVALTTTDVAGSASVSAQATGVTAGTATLKTIKLNTLEPSRLAIYAAPSKLNPDAKYPSMLFIQLLNSQGLPALTTQPITVLLSSTDPNTAAVPDKVFINEQSPSAFVDITPGFVIGSTKITASSPGLVAGDVVITTAGPPAEKIVVEFGPTSIVAARGFNSVGTVQLADNAGVPIKAFQPTKITLTSSDPTVAKVPDYVKVLPGQSYASFEAEARGSIGSATITASASGYETGVGTISAVQQSSSSSSSTILSTAKFKLFVVPKVLPPDETEHQALIIQPIDSSGAPLAWISSSFYRSIVLTSSNPQFGSVESKYNTQGSYAIAPFTTTHRIGKTTITASQQGSTPVQIGVEVKGPVPRALAVYQVPPIIHANSQQYRAIVVSLEDGKGNPVTALQDTEITLTSSHTDIVTVQGFVTVPAGENYARANIVTTSKPGESTITASVQGLTSGSMEFKTIGNTSPFKLGVYAVPKTLPSDGITYDAIVVQMQDLSGNPTRALYDIPVSLSSSSLVAGTIQNEVVIPRGSTFAVAGFTTADKPVSTTTTTATKDLERLTVTASTQGYESVTTELRVGSQPFTVTTSKISAATVLNTPVVVDVFSGSLPVKGATLTISGENAEVRTFQTDENGHAEGQYLATMTGKNSIIITVSKPGYMPFTKTQALTVKQSSDPIIKATTEGGRDIDADITYISPGGKATVGKTTSAKPILLKGANYGTYTLSAPPEIRASDGIYKFVGWSDGVTENPRSATIAVNSVIAAKYSATYLLQANTKYGSVSGTGWYPEGEKATLSVSPTSSTGILVDSSFAGWSGDIAAASVTTGVTMNSPKIVTADWNENYLKMIMMIAAGGGAGGFIFYNKKIKPARKEAAAEEEKAPDLDWFKT